MEVEFFGKTVGIGKYKELSSEEIISAIARHGIIKEDNGKLVRYLMDHKHWSPLDMINFIFKIKTSRAMGRELLRHKSNYFQEISQRYDKPIGFETIELRKQHEKNRQSSTEVFDPIIRNVPASERINTLINNIESLYYELLNEEVAKECARMILPECTETTITVNGTLRSLLAFLNVRMHEDAQKEIQLIAELIGEELEKELPNVFAQINWRKGLFM